MPATRKMIAMRDNVCLVLIALRTLDSAPSTVLLALGETPTDCAYKASATATANNRNGKATSRGAGDSFGATSATTAPNAVATEKAAVTILSAAPFTEASAVVIAVL